MVYFECRFVLLSSLHIYFQNSTSMVNEGFWIGLEVANTPASRLSAPSVRHHTRGGCHQCLVRVQPHASGGSALHSHEAFVNEVAMFAELRRARPCWGADKHEWLRWQRWARRYRNAPFSAEFGPHSAHQAQGEHTIRSQQALIMSALHHHRAPHDQGCLPRALLMLTTCHMPHTWPNTIQRAPARPLFKKASGPTIWTSTYGLVPVLCNRLLFEPPGWAQTVHMFTQRFT